MTFNCSGLNTSEHQLEHFLRLLQNDQTCVPKALLLQECFLPFERMMNIKIPGYRPVTASKDRLLDKPTRSQRGSVILVANNINVQPLKEMTRNNVELIGVKLIGDSEKKYSEPVELWTIYSGPYKTDERIATELVKDLCRKKQYELCLLEISTTTLHQMITKLPVNELRIFWRTCKKKATA